MIHASDLPETIAGSDIHEQAWKKPDQWQAVNAVLRFLIHQNSGCLDAARQITNDLGKQFSGIFPLLDRVCEKTCPECSAPCCRVADANFDFRDLIYIHLSGAGLPPGQPRGEGYPVCRYLGPAGCCLARNARPWICTWYLCPMQKKVFFDKYADEFAQLSASLESIKQQRKQLESKFIAGWMEDGR